MINWANLAGAAHWMPATSEAVFGHGQIWRFWTSLFVHADEKHLLANSFLFYILGFFLVGHFGVKVFPFSAMFFGGVINFIVLKKMPAGAELIGVSGVVFWMGGLWLTLYFLIDRRRSLIQRILRAVGVGLLLFMPAEAFDPSISYYSHGVGFFTGILFGVGYYLINQKKFLAAEVKEVLIEDLSLPEISLGAAPVPLDNSRVDDLS
jgi:rhomboid protease GluP